MLGIFPARLLRSATPRPVTRMKVTYPLSLKVSLWLLLNLVLLTLAGVCFYWIQFGRGWESLTVGALGERLQRVADGVMTELYSATPAQRDAVLAAHSRATGAQFYLFLNEGRQIGGETVTLPPELADEVQRGPGRGGPPRNRPWRAIDDDAGRAHPAGHGLPGMSRPAGAGRMIVHTDEPAETWIGLRVPLIRDTGPPSATTLIIRAPNLLAIARVLDVLPWLGIAAAAFGLSVLFWLPLVGGITRAVRRLSHATEAIAEGRFETRVPETGRDELGQLGQSVNRMAARLDTLINGQKRFLGDVAHELGSPIGRLQVATEILERRADPALREHVDDVREEVQQMALLVNELLAFTKAGLRPRDAELTAVELDTLTAEVLAREDPQRRVRVTPAPGLRVRADRELLARALGNLVRNALRYAGATAAITLRARREDGSVFLTLDDEGPGVPADALARLGEPFYRPESARTRETGGVGLGLAIVRNSIAACGGQVRFENRTPHGFRAEVQLVAAE